MRNLNLSDCDDLTLIQVFIAQADFLVDCYEQGILSDQIANLLFISRIAQELKTRMERGDILFPSDVSYLMQLAASQEATKK